MNGKAPQAHCRDCPLVKRTLVPPSRAAGSGKAMMAIVGESPGRTEAVKGVPFIGPSGDLLWSALAAVGVKRERVHVTNAALCYPGYEGTPPMAIGCCRERLFAELEAAGVKYVLALGKEARESLVGEDEPFLTTRGRWVKVDDMWVLPTIHPAFVLRPPASSDQAMGGPSNSGPTFLGDIVKFVQTSPKPPIPTNVHFWHYPDSKMRKWLERGLAHNHDDGERDWLKKYCAAQGLDWIDPETEMSAAEELVANKAVLRKAASRMVREIVSDLRFLKSEAEDDALIFAIDLETTGYMHHTDRILQLSLSWGVGEAMVISGGLLWQKDVLAALKALFEVKGAVWIGHNGKFDMKFLLAQLGTAPTLTEDTFIMHCALDERSLMTIHALKPLVSQYFDVPDYEGDTISKYLPKRSTSFANVPPQILGEYAGMDTDYTRRLWFELRRELREQEGVQNLYYNLLMPATRAFIPIELRGVQIDWSRLTDVAAFLNRRVRETTKRLADLAGDPAFNPNSHVQVKRVLWDEKGYEPPRIRGKQSRSTRRAVLQSLADDNPQDEFLALMMDVRRYRKLMSSYVRNVHKYEDSNGRVHPTFNVTGTEVGRLSASEPAIQTIPRAYEPTGKLIRDFYVASKGYVLVHADYSQAELRCAAVLSGDEFLLQVYREGRDLHSEIALALYGENFTKEQRNICKMFNFAYLYGGTEHSFAYDAGMDVREATAWVRRYNQLLTGLSTWRGTQWQKLQEQGYIETPTGRRRRFPLLLDSNVADAKKSVVHMPCAGTASDLTLTGLIRAVQTTPADVYPIITVHDSNIVECPDNDESIAETAAMLKEVMETAATEVLGDTIPFVVDVDVGYRWGSLLPYDGTPSWREQVDHRSLFEQKEFLALMQHEICSHCGRWNPPRETRTEAVIRCKTCKERLE